MLAHLIELVNSQHARLDSLTNTVELVCNCVIMSKAKADAAEELAKASAADAQDIQTLKVALELSSNRLNDIEEKLKQHAQT